MVELEVSRFHHLRTMNVQNFMMIHAKLVKVFDGAKTSVSIKNIAQSHIYCGIMTCTLQAQCNNIVSLLTALRLSHSAAGYHTEVDQQ